VSADDLYRAGLWSLLAKFFSKADLCSDIQELESPVKNTIAMEKDLAAIECLEEPIAVFWKEPGDARVRRSLVGFDKPAAAAEELVELLLHLIEGIVDNRVEIAEGDIVGGLPLDHELCTRHFQVDANLKGVALAVVPVRLVDDHATAHDPVVRRLQASDRVMDGRLDDPGMRYVVERDLKWSFHGRSLARDDRGGLFEPTPAAGVHLVLPDWTPGPPKLEESQCTCDAGTPVE
jgi:hypothetical protein